MNIHLGIDISKSKFDAHLIGRIKPQHRTFGNNAAGFKQLDDWLKMTVSENLHTCMEANGRYWERLAKHFHRNGHKVSAVNPARIKGFQQSLLFQAKN